MRGDPIRIVGAFEVQQSALAPVWWRFEQSYGTTPTLLYTTPIYGSSSVLDFGTMRIPAGGYSNSSTDIELHLQSQSDTSNLSCTLTFLQLFPSDNMRILKYDSGTVANTNVIIDDGIEGAAYEYDGSNRHDTVTTVGKPLMLYPGQTHRFIWLLRTSSSYYPGPSPAAETCELTVKYRPRRITV